MKEGPTRLVREDADFARLVAASDLHEPSNEGLDETLSLVTQAASRKSSAWRSLGTSFVAGVAVIGAAVLSVVATGDGAPSAPSVAPTNTVASPAAATTVERQSEPSAMPSATPSSVNEIATATGISAATTAIEAAATTNETPPATSTASSRTAAYRAGDRPVASKHDATAASSTFSEELALLSSARSLLEAGRFAECLRAVDRYDERFHAGIFRQEVAVIRISALVKSGERARGEALAREFLEANTDSPYEGRVRALAPRP